jgi:hypothetical protein
MTIIIHTLLCFLNFIYAFTKKRSKLLIFITMAGIILLIGGAGPNYSSFNHSRDYINYSISYANAEHINIFDNYNFGYNLLMKIGNLLNLDFFIFRLLIITICLILIYNFIIKKYSLNNHYVLLMYLAYPLIIDSEQLRNFIAMTLMFIALQYLKNKSFKNNVKYLLLILISSSFHFAFMLYSLFLLKGMKNRKLLIKLLIFTTLIFTFIAVINNNNIPFLNLIIGVIEDDKVIGYLTSKTNLGYLMPILLHSLSVLLLYWSSRIIKRKSTLICHNSKENLLNNIQQELSYVDLVLWINIICILFFPLFIINLQFYRLIRNLLILNFVVYSIASYRLKLRTFYKFLFNTSVIISVALWFYLDLIIRTNPESVLIPFFTQNFFLN